MNFIFFINLELSAICHKIFNMHVPIYYCGMIVKKAIHLYQIITLY